MFSRIFIDSQSIRLRVASTIKLISKQSIKVLNIVNDSPGSFLVLNDALVIIDFEIVTTFVDGVKATEMPIRPSLGCPVMYVKYIKCHE